MLAGQKLAGCPIQELQLGVNRHRKKALVAAASSRIGQVRAERIVPLGNRQWCEEPMGS